MRVTGRRTLVIGSRGSRLAVAQAEIVASMLKAAGVSSIERRTITTSGDRSDRPIAGDGAFVKEIQQLLLSGEIDCGVHSAKDLPTESPEGIRIAAIPPRGDVRDVLVGGSIAGLPDGARVGTASPRRSAYIRRLRPTLIPVPIRGNVPTRIERIRTGDVDAVMLAAAGLLRLGIPLPQEVFDPLVVLPPPGQGAIAIETRNHDDATGAILAPIDDPDTHAAVEAERAVLRTMGGGCFIRLGAYARIEHGELRVDAAVLSADGSRAVHARTLGDPADAPELARRVAHDLIRAGGKQLLDE